MKKSIKLFVFLPLFLLSACGGGMSGKYTAKGPSGRDMASYNFRSNGTAIYDVFGAATEVKYSVDGNTVKIELGQGGNLLLTKDANGCLAGLVGKFCPEK